MQFGVYLTILVVLSASAAQETADVKAKSTPAPANKNPLEGVVFDEIIVESSLNVRKKTQPLALRRQRSPLAALIRTKRANHRLAPQNGIGNFPAFGGKFYNANFGSSSSSANANSHSQGFGPNGFGSAVAGAQSQGFYSNGPLGGFGASAASSDTQSFRVGPNGIQGGAGLSGSQVYQLPNGHSINLVYSDGFSIGPDGRPVSANSNSITYNRR